jgi:hypothetical protein
MHFPNLEMRRDTSPHLTTMFGQKTDPNVNIEAHGLQARGSINRNHGATHDGDRVMV